MSIILPTQSSPTEELVRGGPSNIQGSTYKQKQSAMVSMVQPRVEGMATAATDSSNGQLYCKFKNADGEQCKKLGGNYTAAWCEGVPHSLGLFQDQECKEEINTLRAINQEELKSLKAYESKFNTVLQAYTTAYHDYTQGLTQDAKLWGNAVTGSCSGSPIKTTTAILSDCKTICENKIDCKAVSHTMGSNNCNLFSDCSSSKPQVNTTYMTYDTEKVQASSAGKNMLAMLEAKLNELAQGMWEKQQKVNNLDLNLQERIAERRGQLMAKNSSLEAAQTELDALVQENNTLMADATNKELEADSTYLRYGTFIAITVALGALSIQLLSRQSQ